MWVNWYLKAPAPNRLWISDFTCVATWAGFVYVAFVIDACARRIVGWRVSRTAEAGFALDALEQAIHAEGEFERLRDRLWNVDVMGRPCFTPVESPESNGKSEAFVRIFKRDCVRVSPIPNAAVAIAAVGNWMEDYNTVHPRSQLGYRSPREYRQAMSQPAACSVDGVNTTRP